MITSLLLAMRVCELVLVVQEQYEQVPVLSRHPRVVRVHHSWWIPTKLKYLAITVMTTASTVLAKSVRFPEHVSPGFCAGIASIVPVSRST